MGCLLVTPARDILCAELGADTVTTVDLWLECLTVRAMSAKHQAEIYRAVLRAMCESTDAQVQSAAKRALGVLDAKWPADRALAKKYGYRHYFTIFANCPLGINGL